MRAKLRLVLPILVCFVALACADGDTEKPGPPASVECPPQLESFRGIANLPSAERPLVRGKPIRAVICGYDREGGTGMLVLDKSIRLAESPTRELVSAINELPAVRPPDTIQCTDMNLSEVAIYFAGSTSETVRFSLRGGCAAVASRDLSLVFIGAAKEPGMALIEKLNGYLAGNR